MTPVLLQPHVPHDGAHVPLNLGAGRRCGAKAGKVRRRAVAPEVGRQLGGVEGGIRRSARAEGTRRRDVVVSRRDGHGSARATRGGLRRRRSARCMCGGARVSGGSLEHRGHRQEAAAAQPENKSSLVYLFWHWNCYSASAMVFKLPVSNLCCWCLWGIPCCCWDEDEGCLLPPE